MTTKLKYITFYLCYVKTFLSFFIAPIILKCLLLVCFKQCKKNKKQTKKRPQCCACWDRKRKCKCKCVCSLCECEFVQVAVFVDGINLSQMHKFLQGLIDEDEADEGGEGLLGEAGNVTDQGTGIRGNQKKTQEGCPEANTGAKRQV